MTTPTIEGSFPWFQAAVVLLAVTGALSAAPLRTSPEEALRFLQSLPPLVRKVDGQKVTVHPWKDKTPEDIRTMKELRPGGHVADGGHLRIDGDDWRCFTAFAQIEKAELWEIEGADDRAFRHLGNLSPTVNHLFVEIATVTDEGLKPLQNLRLKFLAIGWTKSVTDGAFRSVAGIASLEHLVLNGCTGVTGREVAALTALPKLRVLELAGTSLTGANLPRLASLGIEELNVSQNSITGAELLRLLNGPGALPRLKKLVVRKVPLADSELAALTAARPGLQIVH